MRSRLLPLPLLVLALASCASSPPDPGDPAVRTFRLTTRVTCEVPEGARVARVWLALPETDEDHQDVEEVAFIEAPLPVLPITDERGQNHLFLESRDPEPGELEIEVTSLVTREEIRHPELEHLDRPHEAVELAARSRELRHGRDAVASPQIRAFARETTQGLKGPVARARALYRAVIARVRLVEKSADPERGSGRGSSQAAFLHERGDVHDLLALFTAAARAVSIPTREAYGLALPEIVEGVTVPAVSVPWVEIHVPESGWIPIDLVAGALLSEPEPDEGAVPRVARYFGETASGDREDRIAHCFGNLDARRVLLHRGRDLEFHAPRQSGSPVRWLELAYFEVDGVPAPCRAEMRFEELGVH